MSKLWRAIQAVADNSHSKPALIGMNKAYSYSELVVSVKRLAKELSGFKNQVLALYIDNCPEWIMIDLACQLAGITLLPLPQFFSDQQLTHAVMQAGARAVIHSNGDRLSSLFNVDESVCMHSGFVVSTLPSASVALPKQTAKITFTSGSTGEPKGVCLSNNQQLLVAQALKKVVNLGAKKHLSLLPFSTLLENVAGVYLTLLSAGSVLALTQKSMGFTGSSGLNIEAFLNTLRAHQPSSLIVLPELLLALIKSIEKGWRLPASLEFIAVGGSNVSLALLNKAKRLGLPVYEGYGLSECSSVVSLNNQKNLKVGSVGKPLTHVSVQINKGEVMVSGNTFLGYIDQADKWGQTLLATGDLGYLDDEGYLFINGRKKNLLISSFGRNINPEWVEGCALSNGLLKQCVVVGDAKPYCTALLYQANPLTGVSQIKQWIDTVNGSLPDYAQIKKWLILDKPFSVEAGLLTANGRPKRRAILKAYQHRIDAIYGVELYTSHIKRRVTDVF